VTRRAGQADREGTAGSKPSNFKGFALHRERHGEDEEGGGDQSGVHQAGGTESSVG
jgi:hypothetical protein